MRYVARRVGHSVVLGGWSLGPAKRVVLMGETAEVVDRPQHPLTRQMPAASLGTCGRHARMRCVARRVMRSMALLVGRSLGPANRVVVLGETAEVQAASLALTGGTRA